MEKTAKWFCKKVSQAKSKLQKLKMSQKVPKKNFFFWVYIQTKMSKVVALYDPGSQRNLISEKLVKQLGLKSMPRPKPYPLGWLNKNAELQVQAECTFQFAINEKFKDEVTCDTVPLDICQVIFGSPSGTTMLLFHRRENIWCLFKDGFWYHICSTKDKRRFSLVIAAQVNHMVNASKCFVLLIVREVGMRSPVLENDIEANDSTSTTTQKQELK